MSSARHRVNVFGPMDATLSAYLFVNPVRHLGSVWEKIYNSSEWTCCAMRGW